MHVVAAKSICVKEALDPEFKNYIKDVMDNAKILAETIMSRGIDVVSNGTENYIVLVDLRSKNITGKDLEKLLGTVNITVNKNSVPNDTASPFVTSGIRIGTPAITTRGFGKNEVIKVENWRADIIDNFEDQSVNKRDRDEVNAITSDEKVYKLYKYCPFCKAADTKVIDKRLVTDGSQIRRSRE